ncbi:MAG: endonuclease NucS [Actinomycetota bacterium]|nr:endonuclease NucS [Actinomycetota bacterium]MED5220126.1 endonuclease NucS [Actinomycetota bacterium]MEE3353494.1 endonuclease NucS [Actinomycetota bacterium]
MRVVIARCTVDYDGRLTAHLPEAVRLLMVKADGCVAVHADGGAYKPLNWMNAPNTLSLDEPTDGDVAEIWHVHSPKGEQLTITIHEVIDELDHEMGVDPGLVKDGVEAHLQELLAANPTTIDGGLRLVRREFPTDIGPVDLLCRDADGKAVAIEVKRRGEIDGVEQLTRYLDFLNRDPMLRPVRGIFVAQEIKPQARVLATDRGIGCVVVDYDDLRGVESDDLKLF